MTKVLSVEFTCEEGDCDACFVGSETEASDAGWYWFDDEYYTPGGLGTTHPDEWCCYCPAHNESERAIETFWRRRSET